MARYEDKLLDHEVDGIREYDNKPPVWFNWIFYGSIVFSILYIGWYALSFGDDDKIAEYQSELVKERAAIQAYFAKNPIVPPTAKELLANVLDDEVVAKGRARFQKTCTPCHGQNAQGLIGPNLTDEYWIHGGKVTEIFGTIVKGVPAKGMPPWGRAFAPEELAALTVYIRSIQGSNPPDARGPEGKKVPPQPLPLGGPDDPGGEPRPREQIE